ncbi:MAG: alpha-2-macroglobulin family protein, partial [Bacteroidota bacterium]|nr:alpha-2-macroglobulin family protein [Bacteroidota bacterium]
MPSKFIKLTLIIILTLTFSPMLQAQNTYRELWKQIEKDEENSLPKSAYKTANKIYLKASTENNSQQLLKSFIYRMKFKNSFEDYAFESLLAELDSTVKTAKQPEKSVMHSMLGDMYLMYYRANRYKFMNRTNTVNFDNDDIKTWTLDYLVSKVIAEYNLSLENSVILKNTPVEKIELLVKSDGKRQLRPTLYDFLGHKALLVFENTELSLTKPQDAFEIDQDFYFSSAARFMKNKFESEDTLSFKYHSVQLYRDLLEFRLQQAQIGPLLDLDIQRLKYFRNHSVHAEKDDLYFKALSNLETKYADSPYIGDVKYSIAAYFYSQALKYKPNDKLTKHFKGFKLKAHKLSSAVIKNYPKTEAAEKSKVLISNIESHNISVANENVVTPEKKFSIKISWQNINSSFIRVAKISRKDYENIKNNYYHYELHDKLFKKSETVYQFSKQLPGDKDFNPHSAELIMEKLSPGLYLVFAADNEKFSYKKAQSSYSVLRVSDISFARQKNEDNSYNITVFNRTTGKPMAGVNCKIYKRSWNGVLGRYTKKTVATKTTNKNGQIIMSPKNENYASYFIDFTYKNDFLSSDNSYYIYNYSPDTKLRTHVKLFNDRAIYRPGQTIHFKGVVLETQGEKTDIVPGFKDKLTFYDPNRQEVSSLMLKSNAFGTYSGSFEIPKGLRNGNFRISSPHGTKYIKVEEYKRPKFETELLPFSGNYLLGDKVKIEGKSISYSGAPLSNAKVSWHVKRSPRWLGWWSHYFNSQKVEIAHGVTETDDKGMYSVEFKAVPDRRFKKSPYLSFNYSISVDVTDINGETQSTSGNITVGYRALTVSTDIASDIDKQELNKSNKLKIITNNLNGQFIPAEGNIQIFKLKTPKNVLKKRYWSAPDKHIYTKKEWRTQLPGSLYGEENNNENLEQGKRFLEHHFDTKKETQLSLGKLKNIPQGKYVLVINSKDSYGNEVSNRQFFTVFDSKKNKMPYAKGLFFKEINKYCEPGEQAEFLIGSSYNNITVLYQIEHKHSIVKQSFIVLNNETKHIKIPVEEKHRGNFSVHFVFVKNNRFYSESSVVTVPYSNKKLDIEFSTFRDKLQPGQKEQWKITIKNPDGNKAAAEMLAGMYDASLDQFAANHWNFNIYSNFYTRMTWSQELFAHVNSKLFKKNLDIRYSPSLKAYDKFNWFGFSYYHSQEVFVTAIGGSKSRRTGRRTKNANYKERMADVTSAEPEAIAIVDDRDELDSVTITAETGKGYESKEKEKLGKKTDFSAVKVRTNFNETAFFYPHLQTNEAGEIILNFTVPESLTKWKLMTLAHTKDLKFAVAEKEIITQKDLMLTPNSPRFFRENDRMTFPVKISSLSDKLLSGNAQLIFVNPITGEEVTDVLAKGEKAVKPFAVKPEGNSMLSWNLTIPEGVSALSYKVVAKAGDFSDGEQKAIPVLTNRRLVTESLPLPVKGNTKKTLRFDKLINSGKSKTLKHHKLTLEFTSNPAWYAVQALPYIMEYPYECNEQIFSRYYANSLASHIAQSDPKIERVFEAWRNTNTDALVSNLEKNEELKSVLLQETPWVMNGKNESARKKRVGILFDLNRMSNETRRALAKLQKGQYGNGAWPWFTGMPESRYITQHIITGMGHLKQLDVISLKDSKLKQMLRKALRYLDAAILKDYNYL